MEVFHSQRDREVYLNLFEEERRNADVSVLAYCLMTNHVHWIVRPNEADTLAILFRRVQGRYAGALVTSGRAGISPARCRELMSPQPPVMSNGTRSEPVWWRSRRSTDGRARLLI